MIVILNRSVYELTNQFVGWWNSAHVLANAPANSTDVRLMCERRLPIKPCMSVGIAERKVTLPPMLILKDADFDAQALQTRMLRVDIVDLNLNMHICAGG